MLIEVNESERKQKQQQNQNGDKSPNGFLKRRPRTKDIMHERDSGGKNTDFTRNAAPPGCNPRRALQSRRVRKKAAKRYVNLNITRSLMRKV